MKTKYTIKKYFNMIEVVLAMAVIALAMTSVLALLPVGLNASRDALNMNYSSDAIANFAGRIRNYVSRIDTNGTATPTDDKYFYSPFVKSLPLYLPGDPAAGSASGSDAPPDTSSINTASAAFAEALRNGILSTVGTRAASVPSAYEKVETGIYRVKTIANCFIIMQGRFDSNGDPVWITADDLSLKGKPAVDLLAMIYIWKKAPSCSVYAYDTGTSAMKWQTWPTTTDAYKYFTALNFEVSWPLAAGYTDRERSYFRVEFINPKPSEY